jgi:hypothetical protein
MCAWSSSLLHRIGQRGQLVDLQAPLVQLPQLTTPPEQFMQQRCLVLVELFWQYGVVQACARADGSKNSNAALLSRPNDLRMCHRAFRLSAGTAEALDTASADCAAVLVNTTADYRRAMYCPSRQHR